MSIYAEEDVAHMIAVKARGRIPAENRYVRGYDPRHSPPAPAPNAFDGLLPAGGPFGAGSGAYNSTPCRAPKSGRIAPTPVGHAAAQ
jgi:hypothetical protein